MPSEFLGLETATLQFQQAGNTSTTDVWGNIQPTIAPVAVDCYLKIVSDQKTTTLLQQKQRSEPDAVAMQGYCVTPQILPAGIKEEDEALMTWNDRAGKFVLVLINPPYGRQGIGALIEQEAGTKILGWFVPTIG